GGKLSRNTPEPDLAGHAGLCETWRQKESEKRVEFNSNSLIPNKRRVSTETGCKTEAVLGREPTTKPWERARKWHDVMAHKTSTANHGPGRDNDARSTNNQGGLVLYTHQNRWA